jgi:O-antigen biosynthesis protein
VFRNSIKWLLRNQRLKSFLRDIYVESQSEVKVSAEIQPAIPEIPEIGTLTARESQFKPLRLNLLVPALSAKHVFGGIATALRFFEALGKDYENLRIILTDEATFTPEDNFEYKDWSILSLEALDQPGRCVVPAADRYGKTLSIGQNDYFIATAWWTAILTKSLQSKQAEIYNLNATRRFIYLIQDFEPGFYPWSSRYALAESTYKDNSGLVAVFNTSILRNFFEEEGFKFRKSYCFEPVLHQGLKPYLNEVATTKRTKRILVYGRPSTARNAYEIIILALMMWANKSGLSGWEFISVGEMHKPIELGNGNVLHSLGKLSIEAYAEMLLGSYAGISLMISPHPSYPPLEMAAFGLKVITNKYESKDLSYFSDNIISIDYAAPELVCDALRSLTNQFSENICTSSGVIPDTFLLDNPFKTLPDNLISDLLAVETNVTTPVF